MDGRTGGGGGDDSGAVPPFVEVPREEGDFRFAASFDVDGGAEERAAARAFFEEHGYAVFRGVLSAEECRRTRDAMWGHLERSVRGLRRGDRSTWPLWKSRAYGMPSGRQPVMDAQFLRNRQNRKLYEACRCVLGGAADLRVNHDRWAIYRPTEAMPEARTPASLHIDFNPWLYGEGDGGAVAEELAGLRYASGADLFRENNLIDASMGRQLQLVVNLADNYEEDGGFQIVPGSHKTLSAWLARRGPMPAGMAKARSVSFADDALLVSRAQRVPMREGSVVVWDQRCAHGSRPNASSRFRAAMFCRMFDATRCHMNAERARCRALAVWRAVRDAGVAAEVTDVGRTVFGFNDLPRAEAAELEAAVSAGVGEGRVAGSVDDSVAGAADAGAAGGAGGAADAESSTAEAEASTAEAEASTAGAA